MKIICILLTGLFVTSATAEHRPNILFFLSEDQGAHLSFLDTPGLQTPNIDAIAKSGIYFDDAFVAYPVCSASKASIYTGLYGHTNGLLNNTYNFHRPASQVTDAERGMPLSKRSFIRDPYITLTQILHANGYYQGVTHKLHVLPNTKFPYDKFLEGVPTKFQTRSFLEHAKQRDQPWFLMVNIPYSHRPYPNSDKESIRPTADAVEIPPYLPDTPVIRKDWTEYLAGIEKMDAVVGQTMATLDESGQRENTIVIFMSDHGPTYPHGKMTMYDLGLRVPLIFSGPKIAKGVRTDALASGVDLLPSLMELIPVYGGGPLTIPDGKNETLPYDTQGVSLANVIRGKPDKPPRDFIFAEISNRGAIPNDGMQERSVYDGRWKLIYREKVETKWRQVNADTRQLKVWGNRTYVETIRLKDKFPRQYQILAEMDPQNLGGDVPGLELYDLKTDPHEMKNLADDVDQQTHRKRLKSALREWAIRTNDSSISLGRVGADSAQ